MFTSAAYPGSTSWRSSANATPLGSEGNAAASTRGTSPRASTTSPQADTHDAAVAGGGDSRKQSTSLVSSLTAQQQEENQHRLNLTHALLDKFPQPLRLQVTIPYASAVYSVNGLYITYCMQIRDEVNDVIWQCAHRYSEYRALHMHLGKGFASGFPPVLLRSKSNRSKKEIETRRVRLEAYMRKVVSGIIEAYNGNLGRWASQHAAKIVSAAAAEVAKHKGGKRSKGHQHRTSRGGQRSTQLLGAEVLEGQRAHSPTNNEDPNSVNPNHMYNAFVGRSECSSAPETPTTSRAASPEPFSSSVDTGRLSEVALQQYMLLLQQQRQQIQEGTSGGSSSRPTVLTGGQADELHVDANGTTLVRSSASSNEGVTNPNDMTHITNDRLGMEGAGVGEGEGVVGAFSALISMVPATMPPYLSQLTQLLRFIHHPFLDDWENVTFLAAPSYPDDDDRLSVASEANHYGRGESGTFRERGAGRGGVDILGDDGGGGSGSGSRASSRSRRSRSSFDGSSSSPLAFGGSSRSRSSSSVSSASSFLSNTSAHNSPLAHPSAVATRWRPPAVLPGLRLGLSMPLVNISLSIESVWEAHVRGEKGTRKGQLRHRYDEASAICAHIASKEHLLDCLQMQEFIMEFRRKHPIQAYLRFERVLENNTPNTASRSDRVNGGGRQQRSAARPRGANANSAAEHSTTDTTNNGSAFEEEEEDISTLVREVISQPLSLGRNREEDGDVDDDGGEGGVEASLDLDLEAVVGSPLSRHHRSIAGSSTDSIHETFPVTLALATKAAGGVGVLYDPALDEATTSMALAQAEENASCHNSSIGLNSSIVTAHMQRVSSVARSTRGIGAATVAAAAAGVPGGAAAGSGGYPEGLEAENQFIDSIGLHFTLRPDYHKFDLEGVRKAKEIEKMRRRDEEGGADAIHSFMPRRSISIIDTGAGTRPGRSRTPNPAASRYASTTTTTTAGPSTDKGRSDGGVLRGFLDFVSGVSKGSQRGGDGGKGTAGDKAFLANPNARLSPAVADSRAPLRALLPLSGEPVPTACAEYIAKIKGEEVEDCRCTDGQFCSNASAAPREAEGESEGEGGGEGEGEKKSGHDVLGDVYVTQSGYSIIVCPPPVPKVGTGAQHHGSNRD